MFNLAALKRYLPTNIGYTLEDFFFFFWIPIIFTLISLQNLYQKKNSLQIIIIPFLCRLIFVQYAASDLIVWTLYKTYKSKPVIS